MMPRCRLPTKLKPRFRFLRPKKTKVLVQVSLYSLCQRWSPFDPHTLNAARTTILRPASTAMQAPRDSGIEREVDDDPDSRVLRSTGCRSRRLWAVT